MNVVFADAFYWIALANVKDGAHERANAFGLRRVAVITTEEVLVEYFNYFADWGPNLRRKVQANAKSITRTAVIKVLPQSTGSFYLGVELFGARLDKGYSLTDCISMQTMRGLGISEVLTNDVHFEQEGFRALLREARSVR